jgi:hypothetical protein
MRRVLLLAALAAMALGSLVLSGCSTASAQSGGMALPKVWGYVAGEKFAQLDVADQLGAKTLTVKRALVPTDAWVVVHLDDNGMPGKRVGLVHISKGENVDVKVPLKGVTTQKVIVALHADKGTPGVFDFDMMKKAESADRPFFVNEKELGKEVAVRSFGVKAGTGSALIQLTDQPGSTQSVTVDRVVSPGPAWLVVHQDDNGMPGKRLGYVAIPGGESASVVVTLSPSVKLTDSVLIAVHADRGTPGQLEFNMDDKVDSPDQPYFVDGKEVAAALRIK